MTRNCLEPLSPISWRDTIYREKKKRRRYRKLQYWGRSRTRDAGFIRRPNKRSHNSRIVMYWKYLTIHLTCIYWFHPDIFSQLDFSSKKMFLWLLAEVLQVFNQGWQPRVTADVCPYLEKNTFLKHQDIFR